MLWDLLQHQELELWKATDLAVDTDLAMDTETHNSIYRCLRAETILAELCSGICCSTKNLSCGRPQIWLTQSNGKGSSPTCTINCDQCTLSQWSYIVGTIWTWGGNAPIKRFKNSVSAQGVLLEHVKHRHFWTSTSEILMSRASLESRSFYPRSFLEWKITQLYKENNGEGNGTPLQHSCLENPMDGGAW